MVELVAVCKEATESEDATPQPYESPTSLHQQQEDFP